jgi:cell fate regulator YaaT (PSP1 superfamily)
MAKLQNLPLSPMEISGACGRLLCCLTYEQAYYEEVTPKMPRNGDVVTTDAGAGKVVGSNVIKETVNVEMESGIVVEVPLTQIQARKQRPSANRSRPRSRRRERR